jgi:hypothetical protein
MNEVTTPEDSPLFKRFSEPYLRVVDWGPIGFVLIASAYIYIIYVFMCVFQFILGCDSVCGEVKHWSYLLTIQAIAYLILGHIVLALWLISYYRVIRTEPGHIPQAFIDDIQNSTIYTEETSLYYAELTPSIDDENTFRSREPIAKQCKKCNTPRPPRAHHCKF